MNPSDLTAEQHRAVIARGLSVLLSSGAGCGKTHVLTARYLSHLRDGAEVGQLVAITFTERAARQMRGRIRQTVLSNLRAAPQEAEAESWARHLRNLETAPISTIHAFCGTLLRQYAVEVGLDPGFDVLEDVLAVNLGDEALTESLQKLLTAQSGAGEDLRQLVLLFGWRGVTEAIQHLADRCDGPAWQRWLSTPAAELAACWEQFAQGELRPHYLQYVLTVRPKIASLLPLLQRHPPVAGPLVENVRLLLEELPLLPQAQDLAATVARLNEAAKVGKQGSKAWPDPAVYEQIKDAFTAFREDIRGLKLDSLSLDPASLLPAIEVGQRFLRVALETRHLYQERKRQHGVVDFDDLLVLARDLLRDRPEVRRRLQERFRFLLIDEQQDTDPVQMELVEALCGAELTVGKLFAVGDSSQSIYRFRGANVSLFQDLRLKMPHEGRQALTLNFRSQPAILDFTNALLADRLAGSELLRPHRAQLNPGACIEFLWMARDEQGAAAARLAEAEGIAGRLAAMIGKELLVACDSPEGPSLREVRRGDIVLLFRSMSNVHLYESILRRYGIDYYLVGGRAFFAQQEILDLLHLLRALENPQDDLSLAGTLRSPFCCLSDEALFALRLGGGAKSPTTGDTPPEGTQPPRTMRRGLWASLNDASALAAVPASQRERVLRARTNLERWRGLKDRLPIARLLGEVLADSGYDAAMQLEYLGDRKLANLWKLIDLARTFDRSGLFGLPEFIARLGDLVANQPREEQAATQPENADVVRLMSIHQAKGLEFPVVVLADLDAAPGGSFLPVAHWDARLGCVVRPPADDEPPPFTDQGWALWRMREEIEEWHESMRILYVACTRAEDVLILSSTLPADLRPSSPWMQALAAKFDLRTGACLDPVLAPNNTPRIAVRGTAVAQELPVERVAAPPASLLDLRGRPDPVPVRSSGQVIFTVEELESWLASPETARQEWERGDFATPFDAEDGRDQSAWYNSDSSRATSERVLHVVLQQGNLAEPHEWQPLLRRTAARLGLSAEEARKLEEALARFLSTSSTGKFWEASCCWKRQEFLLNWPGTPVPGGRQSLVIRGTLDLLWCQGKHAGLLWLTTGPLPQKDELPPGLAFWAHAAQLFCGVWPQTVAGYSLSEGRLVETAGRRWRSPAALQRFADSLADRFAEEKVRPS